MKKKILKFVGILIVLSLLAIVGVYFYINSSSFIQGQVLPKVSEALGKEVKAEEVHFSLFSKLELKNVTIGEGDGQLLKAGHIKARYQLMPMLSKKIYIDEILIENVDLLINEKTLPKSKAESKTADNSSSDSKKSEATSEGDPLEDFSIKNVSFKNLNIKYSQTLPNTEKIEAEIKDLNLSLPELAMNKSFALDLSSQLGYKAGKDIDAQSKNMTLTVKGNINNKLEPGEVSLNLDIMGLRGTAGSSVQLEEREIKLSGSVTKDGNKFNIKNFLLQEVFKGKKEASIKVEGVLDPGFTDTNLKININNVGPSILNLATAPLSNVPFWQTYQQTLKDSSNGQVSGLGNLRINFNGHIKSDGITTESKSALSISKLPVSNNNATVSELDLKISHLVNFTNKTKALTVKNLNISLMNKADQLILIDAQGQADQAAKSTTLTLNKAQINPEIGNFIPQSLLGDLKLDNINLNIPKFTVTQGSQGISLDTQIDINQMRVSCQKNKFKPLSLSPSLVAKINVNNDNLATIKALNLKVDTSVHSPFTVKISGQVDGQFKSVESSKLLLEINEKIDVDSFMALLPKEEEVAKEDSPVDSKTEPTKKDAPTKTEEATALKLSALIKVQEVLYQGMNLKEISLDTVVDGNTYTLKDSSFKIMGSPVKLSAQYVNSDKPDYSLKLNTDTIQLSPFIALYASEYIGKLDGGLALKDIQISGKGFEDILANLNGKGSIDLSDIKAKDFAALPKMDKNKNLLNSVVNIASSSLTDVYSKTLSASIGIDPTNLHFPKSTTSFSLANNTIKIPNATFSNKKYKINLNGDYNLKSNFAKFTVSTGISGLVSGDKQAAALFSDDPEKDGLRYLKPITIDTAKYNNKSIVAIISSLTGDYAAGLLKSVLSTKGLTQALKGTGKDLVKGLLDGVIPGKKKKKDSATAEETDPVENIKKKAIDSIFKKLF